MDQQERNKRKQIWMAHAFGIGKRFAETGASITSIMENVSSNHFNEFDAYTAIMEEIETTLHECGIAGFSEKFIVFMLSNALMKNAQTH